MSILTDIGARSKQAQKILAKAGSAAINQALNAVADALEKEAAYMDANLQTIKDTYLALAFYQVLDAVSEGWSIVPSEQYETLRDWNYAVSIGNLYTPQG